MESKIPFGLRDGRVVHINEMNQSSDRGLKCRCVCPGCGEKLEARLGNVRTHYFAHDNSQCSSINSIQTALHIFAKDILFEHKKIKLPELKISYDEVYYGMQNQYKDNEYFFFMRNLTNKENSFFAKSHDKVVVKEQMIDFDEVMLEKRFNDFIPDIIVFKNKRHLILEIAVTHFVDDIKKDKIKKSELSAIEIDLSDLDFKEFDREEITNRIINDTTLKDWIFNSKALEIKKIMEEEIEAEILRVQDIIETKRMKVKKAEEIEKRNEKAKIERIRKVIEPDFQRKIILKYENELMKSAEWKKIKDELHINDERLSPIFNVKVPGENVFKCDRRLWQSLIYKTFIYRRKGKTISLCKIVNWAKKYSKLPLDWDFVYTKKLENIFVPDLTDAINGYIKTLIKYDFVKCSLGYFGFWDDLTIIEDNHTVLDKYIFNEQDYRF